VGPNPTDRAKYGVKRSPLVEKDGGPLAIVVAGADVPDAKLLARTIEAIVLERPEPESEYPQHLCLDKAYDNDDGWGACVDHDYTPHIALIRDERPERPERHPARRWVVERTLAWLSKCRGILIRWEKQPENYLGLLELACGLVWFRRYHRLVHPTQGRGSRALPAWTSP
jgi:putative transposase